MQNYLVLIIVAVVVVAAVLLFMAGGRKPAEKGGAAKPPVKPPVPPPEPESAASMEPEDRKLPELPPEPPPSAVAGATGTHSELNELFEEMQAEEKEHRKIEIETFPLILAEDLPDERREEFIGLSEKLPRPPSLVHDILDEVFHEEYEPARFAEIVERDPILTGKLIKTVNSAEFALRSSITSVDRAVTYLGHNVVKHITLKLLLDNVFTPPKGAIKQGFMKLWAASFVASSIATAYCKEKGRVDGPVISTIAMLSYLGNFMILTGYPEKMKDYFEGTTFWDRVKLEQGRLGVNAAVIGDLLAGRWDYPEILQQGIRNSLRPLISVPEEFEGEGMQRTVIAWAACRLGDLAVFENLSDIREARFKPERFPEHHFMDRWLHAAGMDDFLLTIFQQLPAEEINKALKAAGSF